MIAFWPRGLDRSPTRAEPASVVAAVTDGTRGRATVTVCGHLTGLDAEVLETTLVSALQASSEGLDLDLSQVSYCDTAGLRMLVELRERALASGRTVVVTTAGGVMRRLMETTGTAQFFIPCPQVEEPDPSPLVATVRTALLRAGLPLTARLAVSGFLHVRADGDAVDVSWRTGDDRESTGAADRVLGDAVVAALTRVGLRIQGRTAAGVRATADPVPSAPGTTQPTG
ncbi:STAS domain-containing protein [Streptomyces sp. NPDC019507]|uniref:STAS domain-containing protein n=1 Tax=Streptomyces sp. NPDC019507 TaxID=3154689 RepID=UPI0033CFCF8F